MAIPPQTFNSLKHALGLVAVMARTIDGSKRFWVKQLFPVEFPFPIQINSVVLIQAPGFKIQKALFSKGSLADILSAA